MKKVISFFILAALVFSFGSAFAQTGPWTWQHPTPQGNTIRWVKYWDANNWYAVGLAGTFMKTSNAGTSWTYTHLAGPALGTSGQKTSMYYGHFFNANTGMVFGAGTTGGNGIWRTTNAGTTWDSTNVVPFVTGIFYFASFVNSNLGYASCTSAPYAYRTTNAGLTWEGLPTAGTTCYDIHAFDSLNIIVATTLGNVKKSTDGGATWTTISTGASTTMYRMVFSDANTGYIYGGSTPATGFRYTTNAGLNWTTPANTGLAVPTTSYWDIDIKSANIYLTQNSSFVYKSTNMGASWDTLGFLAPVAQQPWTSTYYSLDIIPGSSNDDFIIGGAFGLINKRAGATNTTYTKLVKPGTVTDVWAQSSTGTVIAVGASTIAGTVYDQIIRSTDGGSNWAIVPYSTTSRAAFNCIQMIDNNTGWVCGTLGAVYKTTNGGLAWDSVAVTGSTNSVTFRKVDFINANTGWLFATFSATVLDSATIWKTTDAGANWTPQYLSIGALSGVNRGVYGADMVSATHGTLVNYTPRPYHTTDGGATWTLDTLSEAFGGFFYDIKMFTPTSGILCGSSGRVFKTTNGTFWDTLSVPTRSYSFNGLDFINPSVGYLAGSTGVMMLTSNGGATWTQTNTYGSTMNNVFITPDTKAFTVGSNGYMYKNNNMITGIAGNENSMLPQKYTLEQNYPNPFNPTTTISFTLPKVAVITLKIYDITGREVMKLINNQQFTAGVQKVQFNGSNLASGVYFYSLIADNNLIGTKKMLLVK